MTPEDEIQNQADRFQQRIISFAEVVETAGNATETLPQLPRKQRAREAFRLQMILAEETSLFLEEFFAAAQTPHLFELLKGERLFPRKDNGPLTDLS